MWRGPVSTEAGAGEGTAGWTTGEPAAEENEAGRPSPLTVAVGLGEVEPPRFMVRSENFCKNKKKQKHTYKQDNLTKLKKLSGGPTTLKQKRNSAK